MKTLFSKKSAALLALLCAAALTAVSPARAAEGDEPPVKTDLTEDFIGQVSSTFIESLRTVSSQPAALSQVTGYYLCRDLQEKLQTPVIKDEKSIVLPSTSSPDHTRLVTPLNALLYIDSDVRPAAVAVLRIVTGYEVPRHVRRFDQAFTYLNAASEIRTDLRGFNEAYLKALAAIKDIENRASGGRNVDPIEILFVSGFENYFGPSGRGKGMFDAHMRVADKYLYSIAPDLVKGLETELNDIERACDTLNAKIAASAKAVKGSVNSAWPTNVLTAFSQFETTMRTFVASTRELIAKIENGTDVSDLRNGKVVSGGFMLIRGDSDQPGQPRYWERAQKAFREVRDTYNAAAYRVNEKATGNRVQGPVTRWPVM